MIAVTDNDKKLPSVTFKRKIILQETYFQQGCIHFGGEMAGWEMN